MAGGSKFRGIFDAAREPEPPPPARDKNPTKPQRPRRAEAAPPEPTKPVQNYDGAPAEPSLSARRIGRPPVGKKSDPNYTQVTAYVRRDLYRDVRIALLQDGSGEDFSELVDRLLEDWRRTRGGNADG